MGTNAGVGIARHWIQTAVNGIVDWSNRSLTLASRPTIFWSTIAKFEVLAAFDAAKNEQTFPTLTFLNQSADGLDRH